MCKQRRAASKQGRDTMIKENTAVATGKGPLMLIETQTILGKYWAIVNLETRELRTIGTDYTMAVTNFNKEIKKAG